LNLFLEKKLLAHGAGEQIPIQTFLFTANNTLKGNLPVEKLITLFQA